MESIPNELHSRAAVLIKINILKFHLNEQDDMPAFQRADIQKSEIDLYASNKWKEHITCMNTNGTTFQWKNVRLVCTKVWHTAKKTPTF